MEQQLFALYVQATYGTKRRQWIVMPPMPETFNGAKVSDKKRTAIIFSREQHNPSHRATWKNQGAPRTDSSGRHYVSSVIQSNIAAGWEIGPLVICETTIPELHDAAEGKTPWPVLNRFKKIYNKKHGIVL